MVKPLKERFLSQDFVSLDGDITWEYPVCNDCVHFDGRKSCKAYPKGIPDDIITNETFHSEVIPGQKGTYTFKRKST